MLPFLIKGIWQYKLSLSYLKELFRILLGLRNKSTYLVQKQRAFRHLGYAFDTHIYVTSRVKSEIFILQTTSNYQYETRFSEVFLVLN
jgi:hypothetical protein